MQHVQEEDKENNSAPVKLPHSTNLLIKGARTTDLISRNDIHQVNSDLNLKQKQTEKPQNKQTQTKPQTNKKPPQLTSTHQAKMTGLTSL